MLLRHTRAFGPLAALLLALHLAPPLSAQQPDEPPASTSAASVALVLGGGGARGLAHAGVIATLERRGFQPGLVVGTSMGAIIGALYAAGYDAATIMEVIRREDWAETFAPLPEVIGPAREPRHPVLRMAVDLERARFKQGFIPDWRINRLLVRLLFEPGARARGDFDRLPRGYRAVAASLLTGEAVVLGRGDLARAVRASMAVPGVFSPVELGDDVLVDGGIADYLPVSVARRLGASDVVAVDVVLPPPVLESTGPVDLAGRAVRLLLRNAGPEGEPPEVLILPPIDPGYSSATFPRDARPLLEAGAAAARDLPSGSLPATPAAARAPEPLPEVRGEVVVAAAGPLTGAYVSAAFEGVAPGTVEPARVLRAVDALYASGLYAGVWPRVDSDGRLRVETELVPASSLRGAAGYHTERGPRGWVDVHRRRRLRGAPAELELALSASAQERFASAGLRRYLPRRTGWWLGLEGHALERDVRWVGAGEVLGRGSVRRFGGVLALEGRRLAPDLLLSVGAVAEAVRQESDAAPYAARPSPRGLSAGVRAQLSALPRLTPVVGTPARVEVEGRWGEVGYGRAALAGTLSERRGVTWLALFGAAEGVSEETPVDVWPTLGDGVALPGLRWGEGRGRARALAGADAALPFPLEGHLRLRVVGARLVEPIGPRSEDLAWSAGGELGAIWSTPLGPIEVAAGVNTAGLWTLAAGVGPRF